MPKIRMTEAENGESSAPDVEAGRIEVFPSFGFRIWGREMFPTSSTPIQVGHATAIQLGRVLGSSRSKAR